MQALKGSIILIVFYLQTFPPSCFSLLYFYSIDSTGSVLVCAIAFTLIVPGGLLAELISGVSNLACIRD